MNSLPIAKAFSIKHWGHETNAIPPLSTLWGMHPPIASVDADALTIFCVNFSEGGRVNSLLKVFNPVRFSLLIIAQQSVAQYRKYCAVENTVL